MNGLKGWRSRGYLPHFEAGPRPQMVTFRLADSMPAELLAQWEAEQRGLRVEEREIERRKRIESYLDSGRGECWLEKPEIAMLVESALLHFDGEQYRLHAWTIMPNHAHTMFTPAENRSLASILHGWKGYSGLRANALLGRSGPFWQREYFDRVIRDERHFAKALEYVELNPVSAGLCALATDWPWGSARFARGAGHRPALPGAVASFL